MSIKSSKGSPARRTAGGAKYIICMLLIAIFLISACTAPASKPAGPVSGKYCVLGADGERTFPERTALSFDFENGSFNFGLPFTDSSWRRVGELTVEGNRITAVSNRQKAVMEGDQMKIEGYYTWIFELEADGRLRFVEEGSDTFDVYGTQLNKDSILVRIGDQDAD